MRRYAAALTLALMLTAPIAKPVVAEGERAGAFDYYILSLSWSPGWCATTGDAQGADQCHPRHDHGFTLHGLWPQHETGWPSFCRTEAQDPSRRETVVMADIMGSSGLAWYQWKKHGRCSGLSAGAYFAAARQAYTAIALPREFQNLRKDLKLSAKSVEAAFLAANPGLVAEAITITCKAGRIHEARICLTRDLAPRACGADVGHDCTQAAVMEAVR